MLKKTVADALNVQIQAEFYSSYLYLSMAAWCEASNYEGFGHWMRMQAQEELLHGMKMFDYVNMTGGKVELLAIEQPPVDWDSPLAAFKAAYDHEVHMTENINKLMSMAMKEDDHATANMLQWFVSEQVEEEASVDAICGRLEMMGEFAQGLYMLDRELAGRAAPTMTEGE